MINSAEGTIQDGAIPSGTVTFLFTDIEGSTKLLEKLHEQYATLLEEQRDLLRAAKCGWHLHFLFASPGCD
jgi:class 3 adenylate cyclase